MFVSIVSHLNRLPRQAVSTSSFLLFLLLCAASPSGAQIAPLSLAATIPTTVQSSDLVPAIAALLTGEVMVVSPRSAPPFGLEVRFFAADGALVATRTLDDDLTLGHTATVGPNGLFLVVWTGRSSNQEINAQWFTGAGAPQGSSFVVGGGAGLPVISAPAVDCNSSGCLVVWEVIDGGTFARRLSTDGVPSGLAFSLPRGTGSRNGLSLSLSDDGRIALGWLGTHLVFVTDGLNVYLTNEVLPLVQIFAADGTAAGEGFPPIAEEPQFKRQLSQTEKISVAWNGDNELVAVWDRRVFGEPDRIFSRHFDAAVQSLNGPVVLDASPLTTWPSLLWNDSLQRFLSTWVQIQNNQVVARVLDASGAPTGALLPAGSAPGRVAGFPSLALGPEDRLWLAWQSGFSNEPRTLHLQPWIIGEPICSTPFEIPNGSIPCAEVLGGRFKVFASFRRPDGTPAEAPADAKTDRAAFVFFNSIFNPELAIKMLDGRPVNGNFWFFFGAMSNQEFIVSAYDTETGATRVYYNPPGRLASVGDTAAFPGGSQATSVSQSFEDAPAWQGIELVPEPVESRGAGGSCVASPTVMCLQGGRFSVTVDWRVSATQTGQGQMTPITDQGGFVTFFNPANMELALKVLDGRPVNGHFWVFYASLTNVEFTLRVTDHETGQTWLRLNPPRTFASVADTTAF